MRLNVTRRAVREAQIGCVIPAKVAAGTALAGSPTLLESFFARAIKRHFLNKIKSEKKAEKMACAFFNLVNINVEIV